MSLKDVMAADLTAVFFNPNEFAAEHNINGVNMVALVDSDITKERSNRISGNFDGIYKSEISLFVRAADMAKRPVRGQALRLDGKLYVVSDCTEAEGMFEILMDVNDS